MRSSLHQCPVWVTVAGVVQIDDRIKGLNAFVPFYDGKCDFVL